MKPTILLLSTVMILVAVSTARAESSSAVPRTTGAATKSIEMKDAATGSVPGLITPEQHDAIPYRACINARGWVNGKLICAN